MTATAHRDLRMSRVFNFADYLRRIASDHLQGRRPRSPDEPLRGAPRDPGRGDWHHRRIRDGYYGEALERSRDGAVAEVSMDGTFACLDEWGGRLFVPPSEDESIENYLEMIENVRRIHLSPRHYPKVDI